MCIPVSTNILIEILPASPMIYKAQTKHKISDNALTLIQSQIGILKEEIEKTNTYCTKFKDNINKKLEHKSIHERNENEVLYKRIDLHKMGNSCLRKEINYL